MKRKNILINAVAAKSGGAASYTVNLAEQLATIGALHRYVFYVPRALAKAIRETKTDEHVVVAETTAGSASSWRRFLWDQAVLRDIVKRERIDLLISSSDFGILFPPCEQVLFIRNQLFFSQIYLQSVLPRHTWRFRLEFLIKRWLIFLSARSSNVVITASQSMLNDVRRFIAIPYEKAAVNYFGVPLSKFNGRGRGEKEQRGKRDQKGQGAPFQILYVSEYSDYKNLTTLLKAVICLRQRSFHKLCLLTTADPWQFPDVEVSTRDEDQALAGHPLVAPVTKFTGPVPYEDISKLYADSDLFVFPSFAESFGHPLVEAMASGLPILASDIPICREICDNAAVYFSPLDPNDLAEKLLMLLSNPGLRRQLGEIGRKRAETHFDWKDHVRRLVEIIEQVAADA